MGKPKKDSESATACPTLNEADYGSVCAVKNIYRDPKDSHNWLPEYPADSSKAAENKETAKFAILVQNVKSADPRREFEARSIIIQSERLQSILREEVFRDYPGVTCDLRRLKFDAQFEPFVHRWPRLQKLKHRKDLDETTREHIFLLHDTLAQELGDARNAYDDYINSGVITWKDLWILFEPGIPVVSERSGALAAYEVRSAEYDSWTPPSLDIQCEYVDWSGTRFGRGYQTLSVPKFSGTTEIIALPVYPLRYHRYSEQTKDRLIERGKKFEKLAGYNYREYSDFAVTWDQHGRERKAYVSGRIIVDTEAFNLYSPYSVGSVRDWTPRDIEMINEQANLDKGEVQLAPYHYMLCRPRVRGYFPKTKVWLDFFVDPIARVQWKSDAFDMVVLHRDQKELILAIVESQRDNALKFEDFIKGKGQGIVALLSGPPGTGKTLTAEAVAEHLNVPLYTVGSGDLGSHASEIERNLNDVMKLAVCWKAILLLDECDIFLEARSTHDLERNSIVSVFLRCLEYYEGILFMTTNRPKNIDDAFRSRIHLMLQYYDLDPQSRRQVWLNLLKSSAPIYDLSDDDLTQLGAHELNGRQIKNTVKMAQLLALRRKTNLNRASIDTALGIEKIWQNPNSSRRRIAGSRSSSQEAMGESTSPPNGEDISGVAPARAEGPPKRARGHEATDKKRKKRKQQKNQ